MSAPGEVLARPVGHLQWSAIFAGAIGAAGLSFALHAFAAGIGLSVASTSPTWRETSAWLFLISGLYLLFVALAAFGLGGYIAGRMRAPLNAASAETEFRDGIHGLVTWGFAVILTAIFALSTAGVAALAVAPSTTGNPSQSVAGENTIALELDELFRSDHNIPNLTYRRAEAARILLKASSSRGVPNDDRDYLATVVSAGTGIPVAEARTRVDREVAASARDLHQARVAAVLQALFIAIALLAGAAVAWFAACEGGRDRERGSYPIWDWSFRAR